MAKTKKRYLATEGFRSADLLQYARDPRNRPSLEGGSARARGVVPHEHGLWVLVREIRETKPKFLDDEDAQRLLTRLDPFVVLRYPNPSDPVTVGSEDMAHIDHVCAVILGEMPDDFRAKYTDANPTEKGGRVLMSRAKRPDEL